mmetsp:Transcript_12946/g.16611  ORF Transcript_12946/g.16611 Transcript_12946/m.16611 type:complete len:88 (-) Transcript_12946:101-364(-)
MPNSRPATRHRNPLSTKPPAQASHPGDEGRAHVHKLLCSHTMRTGGEHLLGILCSRTLLIARLLLLLLARLLEEFLNPLDKLRRLKQ